MTDAPELLPIPLEKRRRMARGDYTVNAVGPENATSPMPIWPDATTALVNDLIRDGWVLPENRFEELAALYQAQMRNAHRQIQDTQRAAERKQYADEWVHRVIDYMMAQASMNAPADLGAR